MKLSKQAKVLTQLLDGSVNENDRASIEQRMLEDDAYYEEMLAAETELIDSYAGGEIDADQEKSVSNLISLSSSLQNKAAFSETINQWVSNQDTQAEKKQWAWPLIIGIMASLLLTLGYLAITQHQRIQQQHTQIQQLEQALKTTADQQQQTEQDLARLQLLYEELERQSGQR